MPILVKCDVCGKEFSKFLNDIKKTKHNFCSRNCYALWRINKFVKPLAERRVRQLSEFELGWVSALIDGEGNINFNDAYRGKYLKMHINITNTSKELLEKLRDVLGFGYVRLRERRSLNPHWKDIYELGIYSFADAKALLEQITPYLIPKRKDAETLLKLINKRVEKRENLRNLSES